MSMIRTTAAVGGGGEDHELLRHRYGIGADGVAWHLDTESYKRIAGMQFYRGFFVSEEALKEAFPRDTQGAYAIVLSTGTFWFWQGLERGWVDTGESVTQVVGLPPGGDAGQVLTKASDVDNDVEWANGGGGGSGIHNDLRGVQGGLPSERYHLTEGEAEIVDAWFRRAPTRPVNISPEDAAVDVIERPLFVSSEYHNPFGNAFYGYQLQILNEAGTATVFDTGEIEATVPTYRLAAGVLQVNTAYQWRVRYQGGNLVWSSWSQPTGFRTEEIWSSSLILQPQLIHPGDGSVMSTPAPLLVLSPFDSGSGLTQGEGDFQVSQDPNFSTGLIAGKGMDSWPVDTVLTRGTNYYARARHGDDTPSPGQVLSAWSHRISFAVRKLYRDTRIGIVWSDPARWAFSVVGRGFEPVDLDGGYFAAHPIWSMLEATRAQLVDGQAMSSLMKFWIKSGTINSGPYAGKRGWLIDTNSPSAAELADGWHVHGAFLSDYHGEQDHLLYGRGYAVIVGDVATTPEPYVGGNGDSRSQAQAVGCINARNTDASDPLKRGWHIMNYMEYEAIKLLCLIENSSLATVMSRYHVNRETFHGIYVFSNNTSSSDARIFGLSGIAAMAPGAVNTYDITAVRPGGVAILYVNDLYQDSDGADVLHLSDYLIGLNRADGGIGSDATDGSWIPATNSLTPGATRTIGSMYTSHSSRGILGTIVFDQASGQALFRMSKWT